MFIYLFSPNEQRAGRGGALPDFFFSFFSPCSADHERDWPPCKVVFFGLATSALNVKNNNNNNNNNNNCTLYVHATDASTRTLFYVYSICFVPVYLKYTVLYNMHTNRYIAVAVQGRLRTLT